MSNWIIPGGVLVAERYLYVPSFGLAIIAGTWWVRIPKDRIRHIAAIGVLAPAVLLCISHSYIWRNDFTYYSNMVRVFPNNARARQGYGVALFKARRLEEAKAEFEAGLKIQRTTPLLVGLAGQVIGTERSCVNARALIDEALSIAPKDYFARWLLAECYDFEGRIEEAEKTYRRAVADTPFPDSRLLFDWGVSLERIGNNAGAADAFRRAALVDPDNEAILEKLAAYDRR
jgi:tetratricopeptide (TPR) repeat protein